MAPSPNEATRSVEAGGGRQPRPEVVADASHVPPAAASTKQPSLPPIATLVSDPRTALSAKGRQQRRSDESCQTATKSCDSSSPSSVRWFRPGWERVLLTSLCLMSSAFSVLVAHRQMELETEVAELRAEMRTADRMTATSEDVTFVRQRRLRREAAGDQQG